MNDRSLIIKGVYQETIAKFVLFFTGFVINILLARKLGPTEYGYVGTFTSLLFVFELFLTNGVRQAISRVVSSRKPDTNELWKVSSLTQLGLVLILTVAGLLIKDPLINILGIERYENLYYLIFLILPIEGYFYVKMGFLHGYFKYSKHAISNSVYSIVRMGLTIILLFLIENGIMAILIGTAVGYLVGYFVGGQSTHINGDIVNTKEFLQITIRFLVFYILVTIFINLDVLVLNAVGFTKDLVGQYKASTSIGLTIYYLLATVTQVTLPIISKLNAEKKTDEMNLVINRILFLLIFLTAAAFVMFSFFSTNLIGLFYGLKYLPGASILPLYAVSICLLSILIFLGNIYFTLHDKSGFLLLIFGGLVLYVVEIHLLSPILELLAPPVSLITISILCIIAIVWLLNADGIHLINTRKLFLLTLFLVINSIIILSVYRAIREYINPLITGTILTVIYLCLNLLVLKDLRTSFTYLYTEIRGNNAANRYNKSA